VAFILLMCAAGSASASTPQAWSAFQREVADACLGASSLAHPRAAGAPVDFDDRVGFTVLLIAGRYPQPHMHGRRGKELCLFDRRTRRATVAPADELQAPPPAPAAPAG